MEFPFSQLEEEHGLWWSSLGGVDLWQEEEWSGDVG